MNFIDEAKIYVKSGDGGSGCVSFRREKFIPRGGPDGGNGGAGGNIVLVADSNIRTLRFFCNNKSFIAKNGKNGSGARCAGASDSGLYIKVPLGTQLFGSCGSALLVDLSEEGQSYIVASGGKGGAGNACFKSSRNQSPRFAINGQPGSEGYFFLKLKLLSDIGIIGMPNVGKSTFLACCSNARPKIDNYPFTTLSPNLGVVVVNNVDFVIADIPGLIKNAHLGTGIGYRFLKHIERCKILLHVIDVTEKNILNVYEVIKNELFFYNKELCNKEEFVILSKCDLLPKDEINYKKNLLANKLKKHIYSVSYNDNNFNNLIEDIIVNSCLRNILPVENNEKYKL